MARNRRQKGNRGKQAKYKDHSPQPVSKTPATPASEVSTATEVAAVPTEALSTKSPEKVTGKSGASKADAGPISADDFFTAVFNYIERLALCAGLGALGPFISQGNSGVLNSEKAVSYLDPNIAFYFGVATTVFAFLLAVMLTLHSAGKLIGSGGWLKAAAVGIPLILVGIVIFEASANSLKKDPPPKTLSTQGVERHPNVNAENNAPETKKDKDATGQATAGENHSRPRQPEQDKTEGKTPQQ